MKHKTMLVALAALAISAVAVGSITPNAPRDGQGVVSDVPLAAEE